MAHEITSTDGIVLTQKPAWHGLGILVEEAPTPIAALELAGLGWGVEQWQLDAKKDADPLPVNSHVANIRADTKAVLGVVGSGYRPVQNAELADFVAALRQEGQVAIETAGSIRGGKRIWFLVRGDSIWVGGKDEVKPYLLVANGHDGSLAVTCQPTTVRVVCKNTLQASLAQGQAATTVRFRHEGAIADKLEDAKRALGLFDTANRHFAVASTDLNAKEMTRDELQRFWMEVYAETIEPIPAHPTTSKEVARAELCRRTLATWATNFDHDRNATGLRASAWVGLNAVTQWFDHQRPVRAANDAARKEARVFGSLWGTAAVAKAKAMQLALAR